MATTAPAYVWSLLQSAGQMLSAALLVVQQRAVLTPTVIVPSTVLLSGSNGAVQASA